MKPFKYQRKHIDRLTQILETKRGAFDLSATGTGKTLCALTVAKELGRPAAVVAPLGTLPGWRRTAEALGMPLVSVNYESLTKARGFVTPQEIKLPKNALVIYDEAHKCKNHKTGNAKAMLRIARSGYKILALSATIAHHAGHLRAWNDAFNLANTNSFSAFMYACGYYYEQSKWGGAWLPKSENSVDVTRRRIAPFVSAMTIEDAGEMFKENSVSVEVVSSQEDPALKKAYEEYFRALRAGDKKTTGDHLVKELRARQASEKAKIPYILDKADELTEEGFSVVLFCCFNETIDELQRNLAGHLPAVIRGGQSPAAREVERKRFQENKTRVILCNLQAGGVGLDLHDLHGQPRYSIILPDWSAVSIKQALGRIHRAGAKSPAIQQILYSDVEVEKRMAEAVRAKLHNLDTLHDSETGVKI
mgnify:FL=1